MAKYSRLLTNATTIDEQGEQQFSQAIAIADGLIAWCGDVKTIPLEILQQAELVEDCHDQLLTPGFIDCHTHLVYAGQRADEFKMRMNGMTYAEIAAAGGGILSTVKQVRAASEEALIIQSLPRLLALQAEGVTTLEIKSGYGLDLINEIKMLHVARRLGQMTGLRVKTTFLGAHAVPPEFKGKTQAYVDLICEEMLPALHELGLVDAVDVFCESIAFDLQQTEQIYRKTQSLSLPIKCHADQLSNLGASHLAANMGALSCDHLEYLDELGAQAMAKQGTVAVLLPGAYYFLREKRLPPVPLLRKMGIGMAIATDSNPGSSPTSSLLLMLSMACQFFSLTVPEALAGVTSQASKALGLAGETGSIKAGLAADLIRWNSKDSATLCYYFGMPLSQETMLAGRWIKPAATIEELL